MIFTENSSFGPHVGSVTKGIGNLSAVHVVTVPPSGVTTQVYELVLV